ncbi:hypothetical protein PoB_000012200 [Plakobranchus ocellatus]|uniref:Uncharacterized protein n=1 Tax=Plakobranchus ocellatus TaxID=259542 RepID=A0AAV3XTQ3_9GAST|nr:hypothetical protein PoB_000012200 [Plakobranchus ocellatus]
MSNSQHGIGHLARLPNVHKRGPTQHGIGNLARHPNVHTRGPTRGTGQEIWQDIRMCTQEVKLSTRDRQFGKTSECAHKMSNSPHGKDNLGRLPTMHTKGETLNTGKVSRQDFRMCSQDVQLSTRDRQFGKTSECAQKRSNSTRDIDLERLPNVHTRGKAVWQDFRMCTQEVQLSTRDRQFGKTSEYAHKMSNSPHKKHNLSRLPTMHTRGETLSSIGSGISCGRRYASRSLRSLARMIFQTLKKF